MSLLWTLRKWVDPLGYLKEEEEKRAAREIHVEGVGDGDGPSVATAPRPAQRWVCRVCAHESSAGDYCPACVADTMQRRK